MTTGQVVTVASLLGLGWDRAQVSAAIDAGTLVEVVRGWVAYPTADSLVIEAVEKGGRLGCLSGCRVHGLWTPDHSEPHIISDGARSAAAALGTDTPPPSPVRPCFPLPSASRR